jgi:hypothetical protein
MSNWRCGEDPAGAADNVAEGGGVETFARASPRINPGTLSTSTTATVASTFVFSFCTGTSNSPSTA